MRDDEPPGSDFGRLVTIRRHYLVLRHLIKTVDGSRALLEKEPGSYEGKLNMKHIRDVLGDLRYTRLVLKELIDRQCVVARVGAYGNTVYLPTDRGRLYFAELSDILSRLDATFTRYAQ